jgi:hypothetical protein
MTCHCNGDIDDICLDLEEDILACTHCPDDEYDFKEQFPQQIVVSKTPEGSRLEVIA